MYRLLIKLSAFTLLAIAMVLLCIAYSPKPRTPHGLIVEPSTHDFGTVRPQTVSCNYTLVNRLPYAVRLLSIVKTCGCTTADLRSGLLQPGEKAILHCVFDLRGRSGEFATVVSVLFRATNAGMAESQSVACVATATVVPQVRANPSSLRFSAASSSNLRVSVVALEPSVALVSWSVDHEAFRITRHAQTNELTVSFDASVWPEGRSTAKLIIKTTSDAEPEVSVPIIVARTQ